jgi:integrase/recombinase XerC
MTNDMWIIDAFLDYLQYERNYALGTVNNYRGDIRLFEQFVSQELADSTPAEVTTDMVREWVISLMDAGYASGTVNKMLSSLRSFYKYLLKEGQVRVDPMQKVKGPKKKKSLPVFLKEGEINRLLDEVDFGEGYKGCRNHLIIEMFYVTGMRRAELIGLNDVDVDFSASVIKVTGKRNKQRLIPFDEALRISMNSYLTVRNEAIPARSEAFFVRENGERLTANIVEYLVRQNLSKVVTQKKRGPHVLRHTFATAMLNNEAELGAVKELLGHESLTTTEIYTHTTFEELKKVYNQAHPRA